MALLALLIFLMCVGNIACICQMDDDRGDNFWFVIPTFLVTMLIGFASGLYVLLALAKMSGLPVMGG